MKAAVFDIGATLVTGPPVAPNKVISRALGNVSHGDISQVIMTQPTSTAEEAVRLVESIVGTMPEDARACILELWTAQCSAPVALPGAVEAVEAVKGMGLKIGLLSDIWTPYYEGVRLAIPEVVEAADATCLSCISGRRKPDLHNFRLICEMLETAPEDIVMVGDTYTHDIAPAIELGMATVWVLARPDREKTQLLDILNGVSRTPSLTVECISDVPRAIAKLQDQCQK